jgi:hypothetical protein
LYYDPVTELELPNGEITSYRGGNMYVHLGEVATIVEVRVINKDPQRFNVFGIEVKDCEYGLKPLPSFMDFTLAPLEEEPFLIEIVLTENFTAPVGM